MSLRIPVQNTIHILWQRRGKAQLLVRDRMGEGKTIGVQSLTADIFHVGVVQIVTDQRVA